MFEDKKGSELIRMHAQKDYDVTVHHVETRTIGEDGVMGPSRDTTLLTGDDSLKVLTGNQTVMIAMNVNETYGITQTTMIGAMHSLTVGAAQSITVGAAQTTTVAGPIAITSMANITLTCGASIITMTPTSISIISPVVTITGTGPPPAGGVTVAGPKKADSF
jgi:type VI secretion system secreted protein VgrG